MSNKAINQPTFYYRPFFRVIKKKPMTPVEHSCQKQAYPTPLTMVQLPFPAQQHSFTCWPEFLGVTNYQRKGDVF